MDVKRNAFLNNGFTAYGEVTLLGAQIGGDLDCTNATFKNEDRDRTAPSADRLNVKSSVFLSESFTANGEVRLPGAHIGGDLDCHGGTFNNQGGDALSAYEADVRGSILIVDGFTGKGNVFLARAQIAGVLACWDGRLQEMTLDLTDASAAMFGDSGLNDPIDEKPTIWPQPGNLVLDGFTYGRISSLGRINVNRRIGNWLTLQPPPFRPQPFLQFAKILKEAGDDKGVKRVLIEMEDRLRKDDPLGLITRPLLRLTVGYGYDPLRALWWGVGLSALGWIIYRRSYLAGGIVPTEKDACAEFTSPQRTLPAQYPSFSPLIYSLENSLPVVKLGQADKWQPDPEPDHTPANQSPPMLASRGTWSCAVESQGQLQDTATALTASAPTLLSTVEAGSSHQGGESPSRARLILVQPLRWIFAALARILVRVGLKAPTDQTGHSFARCFGTSPRFVRVFLWVQILLGWLLATLAVLGVTGIVHKD